jgi:serine/threonine-protein kinase RsbW
MGDKHVLTIPGRYERIQHVCQFVAEGAKQAGLDETAIFHVELACDEACTNVIEHAYGAENAGKIVVSWQVKDDAFTVTITDRGRSFDPDQVPPPPFAELSSDPETVSNLKEGGLGIHFMRTLMDKVEFSFDEEEGNRLIMVKKLPKSEKQ